MPPIAVSYGAGVNSQGMLAGMFEHGERPDCIVYSDTGSDPPECAATIAATSAWLRSHGWPEVHVVRWIRQDGTFLALHEWCTAHHQLPSLAYGLRGCSVKWKRQPIEKFLRARYADLHARGERAVRYIGIDAGESHRVGGSGDEHLWDWRRPLIEWDWDRRDCVEAAARVGLPPATKSSCFCCPAAHRREVLDLHAKHPDLFAIALQMEAAAQGTTTTVKGLGRHWSWGDVLAADAAQCRLFSPSVPWHGPEVPCECWEGGQEEQDDVSSDIPNIPNVLYK